MKTKGHKQGLCVCEMARVRPYPAWPYAGLCVFTWWSTAGNLAEWILLVTYLFIAMFCDLVGCHHLLIPHSFSLVWWASSCLLRHSPTSHPCTRLETDLVCQSPSLFSSLILSHILSSPLPGVDMGSHFQSGSVWGKSEVSAHFSLTYSQ